MLFILYQNGKQVLHLYIKFKLVTSDQVSLTLICYIDERRISLRTKVVKEVEKDTSKDDL